MKRDLGKLIYTETFCEVINEDNDGNGHLNNSYYPIYSEEIRQKFLKSFGWRDGNFDKEGISMRVGKREVRYRISLKKGDEIKIKLEVFFRRNPFFYMLYTFYNPSNEVATTDLVMIAFINSKTSKIENIPHSFFEKIKNC